MFFSKTLIQIAFSKVNLNNIFVCHLLCTSLCSFFVSILTADTHTHNATYLLTCAQTQDEYIHLNKIGKPPARNGNANNRGGGDENGTKNSGPSKFDRYRHQDDDDDDEMDEGIIFLFFAFDNFTGFAKKNSSEIGVNA